jgi:transcription elongation factor Elf1
MSESHATNTFTCPLCGGATTVLIAHLTSIASLNHYSCLRCTSSPCIRCSVAEQWAISVRNEEPISAALSRVQ